MPAGLLVTVPAPEPLLVTASMKFDAGRAGTRRPAHESESLGVPAELNDPTQKKPSLAAPLVWYGIRSVIDVAVTVPCWGAGQPRRWGTLVA